MLNKTKYKLHVTFAFLACEAILGVLVQTASGGWVVVTSYACVVLACLFVLSCYEKSRVYFLTQIGLICTVMADLFLVVMSPIKQLPAMIFFSVTQLCYFLRLYYNEGSRRARVVHCAIRGAVVLVAMVLTLIVLQKNTDALSLVSLFYYANLIVNIVFAFVQFKKESILAIGLLLFLLCDTIIGLDVMASSYIPIADGSLIYAILHSGINLAWVFYVPSQALIAISLIDFKGSTQSN